MHMQFSAHLSSRYHAASPHGFSRTSIILLVLTTRNVEMSTIMCAEGKRTPPDGPHNIMHVWCGLETYLLRETNDRHHIGNTEVRVRSRKSEDVSPFVGAPGYCVVAVEASVHHRAVGRAEVIADGRDLIVLCERHLLLVVFQGILQLLSPLRQRHAAAATESDVSAPDPHGWSRLQRPVHCKHDSLMRLR